MIALGMMLVFAYLALAYAGVRVALRTRHRLYAIPLLLAIVHAVMWHVLPLFGVIVGNILGGVESEYVGDTVLGSGLDMLYVLIWIGGYVFVARYFLNSSIAQQNVSVLGPEPELAYLQQRGRRKAEHRLTVLLWICLGATLIFYSVGAILDWPMRANVFQPLSGDKAYNIRYYLVFVVIWNIVQLGPSVACVILLLRGGKVFRVKNWMPLSILSIVLLHSLAMGSRAKTLEPVLYIFVATYVLRLQTKRALAIGVGLTAFIIALSPVITAMRVSAEYGERESLGSRLSALWEEAKGSRERGGVLSFLAATNPARVTGVIAEHSAREGYVGLQPYKGLPFFMIPRMFWIDRPMLGSLDHTSTKQLTFLSSQWTGYYGSNQWLTSSAQPFWVGGVAGVVVIALISGLLFSLLWHGCRIPEHPLALFLVLGIVSPLLGLHYDITKLFENVWLITRFFLPLYLLTFLVPGITKTKPSRLDGYLTEA